MRFMRMRLVLVTGVMLLMLAACRSQPQSSAPVSNLSGRLNIDVPASAIAGSEIVITVSASSSPQEGTPITFLTMSGIEQHVYQSTFSAQIATFTLPGEGTRQAGLTTLIARSGQASGTTSLTIRPAAAVSPVFLLVGPRTVVANSSQRNMAVVVANDAYGNVISDGEFDLRVRYPDSLLSEKALAIDHLVGWSWLDPTTTSGRIRLSAAMGDASAPENSLDAVAASPRQFAIMANPLTADADGRQLIALYSETIQDGYGNVVPDGSLVTYLVETPSGESRRIPSYTIQGVARAQLQAPQTAGDLQVWGMIEGVKSKPIIISFSDQGIAQDFHLRAQSDARAGAIILTAGPVAGSLGQLIPDGTRVNFSLTDPAGNLQLLTAETRNGYAEIEVRLLALRVGIYTAEARIGSKSEKMTFNVH